MTARTEKPRLCRIQASAFPETTSAEETLLILAPRGRLPAGSLRLPEGKDRIVDSGLSETHALSYRLMSWLETREESYEILVFPDKGGLAYYSCLAKRAGLILKNTQIWIEITSPTAWTLEESHRLPQSPAVLEATFMERESLRLADGYIAETESLPLWLAEQGYKLPLRKARTAKDIPVPNRPIPTLPPLSSPAPQAESQPEGPRVSLIVTSYNRPDLLEQALASVRAQNYPNLELVLVDGGSTNEAMPAKLASLAPEFKEKGWQIIRDTNRYIGAARNLGAQKATGDLLFFLDDDNILMPEAIEKLVAARARTKADIFTPANRRFQGQTCPKREEDAPEIWVPLGAALARGAFGNVFGDASFLISKSLFQTLGGFTEDFGIGAEDAEFLAKAAFKGASLFPYPKPLFWYRINPESLSTTTGGSLCEKNKQRSLRPYRDNLPADLGLALAYAAGSEDTRSFGQELLRVLRQGLKNLLAKSQILRLFYFRFRGQPLLKSACKAIKRDIS